MISLKSRFESEANAFLDKLFAEESFTVFKIEDIKIEFDYTEDFVKQNHLKISDVLILTHIPTNVSVKSEINTRDIEVGIIYTLTLLARNIDIYNIRMENYKNGRDVEYIDLRAFDPIKHFPYSTKLKEFIEKECVSAND